MERNVAIYGHAYTHLHHYCWALNSENKANKLRGNSRIAKLNGALADIKYVLDLAPADFVLLPDIYTSRAQILLALKRDGEAVGDLYKAIELDPSYTRAYLRLSDYYVTAGKKDKAIEILEQGIGNTTSGQGNAAALIRRLEKLGKTYEPPPGSAQSQQEQPPAPPQSEQQQSREAASIAPPAPQSEQAAPKPALPINDSSPGKPGESSAPDEPGKTNPYCRFCP